MKVLFINTSDITGGAAIAAWRLAKGLTKYHGVDCHFLVKNKKSLDPKVTQLLHTRFEKKIERIVDKNLSRLGFQYGYFPFSTKNIVDQAAKFRPDVINLHNTHGGYFSLTLLEQLAEMAPIVWTLHDMWSFTSNAAYTFGDDSWKDLRSGKGERKLNPKVGITWGSYLIRKKQRLYSKTKFDIVTPSRWLYNEVSCSPVYQDKNIHHIFNGIDHELFAPQDKQKSKRQIGIPESAPVLMFSADIVWKFGGILPEILAKINRLTTQRIHLLIIGNSDVSFINELNNLVIHKVGYVTEEKLLPAYYSASDALIYPTKADNLPNVLVEAISCGTPCVTFDLGGCGEIVNEGVSGRLIMPFDVESFAKNTIELVSSHNELTHISACARTYAVQNFSLKAMAANYNSLFRSLQGKQ